MKRIVLLLLTLWLLLGMSACEKPDDRPMTEPATVPAPGSSVTEPVTTKPAVTEPVATEPAETKPHTHSWKDATCNAPKTCESCGAVEGSALEHSWVEETCTEPKTCQLCGVTDGAAKGHDWMAASCVAPKTCAACAATEGDPGDHSWAEATCTESKVCTICGAAEGSPLGHSWLEATCTAPRTCINCDATEGSPRGHSWDGDSCTVCGEAKIEDAYGYNKLNGQAMQAAYRQMLRVCKAFAVSREDIAPTDERYILANIQLDLSAMSVEAAVATWNIFRLDHPQYYWLSNTVYVTGQTLELCIDPVYAAGSYRASCDEAIVRMEYACAAALNPGMSQLEKALAIHDFILKQMDYAYEADGVTPENAPWAHNMMGCAEQGSGVCEAYAKTYMYLCRLNGLDSIIVTGVSNGQDHAWNLVCVDGIWYGVDCTFDDPGADAVTYNFFGMCGERMRKEYAVSTPECSGADHLYGLPEMADRGIELVRLSKNGANAGIYAHIDAAFAAMTDPNGAYEIQLFDYTAFGPLLLPQYAVTHQILSTLAPKVESIAIKGLYKDLGNGYIGKTRLMIDAQLTLQSDLAVYDLDIYSTSNRMGALNLQDNTLTCLGVYNQFAIPVTGSTDAAAPSVIFNGTQNGTEFFRAVRVHTYHSQDQRGILFRDDTYIVKAVTNVLNFRGEAPIKPTVYIGELCRDESCDTLFVQITDGVSLTIDQITASDIEWVGITFRFGQLEDFGSLTLGSSDTQVQLILDGQIVYTTTDVEGNELDRWTETAQPSDLTVPIATLKDPSVMNNLLIQFIQWTDNGGYYCDHTEEYTLNDNNQIVRQN